MSKPYFIIEAANTHGGNFEYLKELIVSFSDYKEGFGMKFQPFHPDTIATKDYSYYKLYEKLFFDKSQWEILITKAASTKHVWLDIFDTYGVDVLNDNIDKIYGIKFQSSVLYNFEVFNALSLTDLSTKKIILNVAAQPIENISETIKRIQNLLKPEEILLEFGYQSYPTSLDDSGYAKIELIKSHFDNRLVFADHIDGKSTTAIVLPVIVAMKGIDIIEKHVMLDKDTEYDQFSSLTPEKFSEMVSKVKQYVSLNDKPFINQNEEVYLKNTIMIPILKNDKPAGSLFSFENDFIYRRTGKSGLNVKEIEALQYSFHILSVDKKAGETLQKADFKKAVIATIIAGRLKSTRLPKKALLPIGGIPSVERCIKSCLEFKNVNHTILATSTVDEDAELENYTYQSNVIFHKGDPDDVIRRYLVIAEKLNIDIIIRITADMPFVSHEIAEKAINEHFLSGADYTVPRKVAVGTGVEIINTTALQRVKKHFVSANYSEYMSWYFLNNPEHFRLNIFDLPDSLIRNYRLTLDYPEDLEMFNILQADFDENKIPFDILKAFDYLDIHPEVNNINSHLTLRYKTDTELINILNKVTKIL
jgi:spore coat polysaccharide biosynthesis protein SpsF (cytidylyltransferase family)/sialic acid synthase SpsE